MPLEADLAAILRRADSELDTLREDVQRLTSELDDANSDHNAAQIALIKARAERDAAVKALADHMATHTPDPEPPTTRTLFGASYGTGATKDQYKGRAETGRLYYTADLAPDLTTSAMFKLAYRDGVRHFLLSYRGNQTELAVGNAFATIPDDCTFAATWFHEPEDNIKDGSLTLADWRARNIRDSRIMRDNGVTPVSNLMQYTLADGSGRDVSDYYLDGAHDGMTFDYYMNPAKGKDNPEQAVDRMVQAALEGGAKFTGLGEAGVPDTVPEATAVALIKRLRAKLLTTPEVQFAQFWSSGEFKFTPATADAWFD